MGKAENSDLFCEPLDKASNDDINGAFELLDRTYQDYHNNPAFTKSYTKEITRMMEDQAVLPKIAGFHNGKILGVDPQTLDANGNGEFDNDDVGKYMANTDVGRELRRDLNPVQQVVLNYLQNFAPAGQGKIDDNTIAQAAEGFEIAKLIVDDPKIVDRLFRGTLLDLTPAKLNKLVNSELPDELARLDADSDEAVTIANAIDVGSYMLKHPELATVFGEPMAFKGPMAVHATRDDMLTFGERAHANVEKFVADQVPDFTTAPGYASDKMAEFVKTYGSELVDKGTGLITRASLNAYKLLHAGMPSFEQGTIAHIELVFNGKLDSSGLKTTEVTAYADKQQALRSQIADLQFVARQYLNTDSLDELGNGGSASISKLQNEATLRAAKTQFNCHTPPELNAYYQNTIRASTVIKDNWRELAAIEKTSGSRQTIQARRILELADQKLKSPGPLSPIAFRNSQGNTITLKDAEGYPVE